MCGCVPKQILLALATRQWFPGCGCVVQWYRNPPVPIGILTFHCCKTLHLMHFIICHRQIAGSVLPLSTERSERRGCLARVWWGECWLSLLCQHSLGCCLLHSLWNYLLLQAWADWPSLQKSSVKYICPFQMDPQSSAGLLEKGVETQGLLWGAINWDRGDIAASLWEEHCHLGCGWHLCIISAVMTKLGALHGTGSAEWLPASWLCWGVQLFWQRQIQVLLLSE